MEAAWPAHAADRLSEGLIVACLVYVAYQFLLSMRVSPGG